MAKKIKKIFLPRWQRAFVPPLLGFIWLLMSYQKFSGKEDIGWGEYALISIVFLGAGVVIWLMASGKLPAYTIEEEPQDEEQKNGL
jgi:hypothetical protein